ncbi:MAG: MoaD/ThiS family protein [Promethearchaeota archaeon]
MIDVKIKFLSLLADLTEEEELMLSIDEESSIKDLIGKLILRYGEDFKNQILSSQDLLNKYIILVLNGKHLRSYHGLETLIHKGDEIAFLPAIAGG